MGTLYFIHLISLILIYLKYRKSWQHLNVLMIFNNNLFLDKYKSCILYYIKKKHIKDFVILQHIETVDYKRQEKVINKEK